ncbi:retinol dehydrogenase 13-like [Cylas formicarius]|uniref:retinol dehydrogenase 13-like n=1 Tax=Cylas formicarius TaxID=197179 RepID=UPI002958A8FB|nr:retinol dehydrogenase 13-like [Cylas formicarius]
MGCIFAIVVLIVIFISLNKIVCFYCRSKVCMVGKTAIVTGGGSGIGYQIALDLASKGCRIIIADVVNYTEAARDVAKETHNPNVIGMKLDNQSFTLVREFAQHIIDNEPRLDILINNAGIASTVKTYTQDGLHRTMQVNYFSHFLLTHLLLDLLKKSKPSRIIFTSSIIAYITNLNVEDMNLQGSDDSLWNAIKESAYGYSKLCQAAAAKTFAVKLKGTGVTANAFHPGGVRSKIFFRALREESRWLPVFMGLFTWTYGKSTEEGAQTAVYLAQADEVEKVTGAFFQEGRAVFQPLQLRSEDTCQKIWRNSVKYTKLEPSEVKC